MWIQNRWTLHGQPWRRALLSVHDPRARSARLTAVTDDDGLSMVPAPGPVVLVRAHARNGVARAVDARGATVSAPTIRVRDGDDIEIGGYAQGPQFALVAACLAGYDRGLRTLEPWSTLPDPSSPLGRRTVEVRYPDTTPARLPFVEPYAPPRGLPRIRITRTAVAHDLAGIDPGMVAHELAHALHFAALPARRRAWVEGRYLAWLAARVATGRDPTHAPDRVTTPFVAWIEAFGLFAERFDAFVGTTPARPGGSGDVHAAFVAAELARATKPRAPGRQGACEGDVYTEVFLRDSLRTSLDESVSGYVRASREGVFDVASYRAWRNR